MVKEVVVSVRLPPLLVKKLDLLVELGLFKSRGEALRYAVLRLVRDLSFLYQSPE